MAEQICFLSKGTIIIKAPKKSPALLRMGLVVIAMVCGLFIFCVCLNQSNTDKQHKFLNLEVIDRGCHDLDIDRSRIPYLHYPKPRTFSRAECSCNPVRLFAILTMQRSGSGWFETLLNSHVNVSSNGEIFSVKDRRENFSSIAETLDRVYNLDWFTSASKNQCSASVGFKWMLNQSTEARHLRHGSKNGFSKLHLHTKISKRDVNSTSSTVFDDEPAPVAPTAPTLPSPTAPVSHSSPPGHVDGLRPTAPGHSPGIGHSLHN